MAAPRGQRPASARADRHNVEPTLFYEIMTAHGAGRVGTAALTGAGIMWFFLSRHVQRTRGRRTKPAAALPATNYDR
jgi:hypothetical protein